jgi:hypothetical protein
LEQQGQCVINTSFLTKGYFTLVVNCCKRGRSSNNRTLKSKNKDLVKDTKCLRKRYNFKHSVIILRAQRIFITQYAPCNVTFVFCSIVLHYSDATFDRYSYIKWFSCSLFPLPCSLFLDLSPESKSQPKTFAVSTGSIAISRAFTLTTGR